MQTLKMARDIDAEKMILDLENMFAWTAHILVLGLGLLA